MQINVMQEQILIFLIELDPQKYIKLVYDQLTTRSASVSRSFKRQTLEESHDNLIL